jgi:alpha-galactosidase/6-phospho-beta-glucosidase family protein
VSALQLCLLEPTVTSYRGAVEMVDEMLALQRDVLPPIH